MYFVRAVADRSTSLYYCDARVLLLMEAKSVMSAPVMSAPITELVQKECKLFWKRAAAGLSLLVVE